MKLAKTLHDAAADHRVFLHRLDIEMSDAQHRVDAIERGRQRLFERRQIANDRPFSSGAWPVRLELAKNKPAAASA